MYREGWPTSLKKGSSPGGLLCRCQALVDGHLDDSFQFCDIEWFLEEIVGACFAGQLGHVAIGAEENDGNIVGARVAFEQAGGFDAAGTGYPVVHQDHI